MAVKLSGAAKIMLQAPIMQPMLLAPPPIAFTKQPKAVIKQPSNTPIKPAPLPIALAATPIAPNTTPAGKTNKLTITAFTHSNMG
jgi:hypothetical protein